MMSMANLRAILATVLVVSATLPQASCRLLVDADGNQPPVSMKVIDTTKYHTVTKYYYAMEDVALREPATWLIPLVFFWPFVVILAARRWPDARSTRVTYWLEPLGLLASAYFILVSVFWRDPEIGYYVSLGALGALLLTWLWMTWERFRRWRAAR